MKKTIWICSLLFLFGAIAFTAITPARVTRPTLRSMEKSLDERINTMWPDNPLTVVGPTRAVYLEGYGAVFTAEMSLANEGISLMHTILTPQDKALVVKKKNERVPQLRKALEEALVGTAASLDTVPPNEQVVIQVVLDRYTWEESPSYPAEMIFQATRQKLLDVKHANGAGMETAIKITEH
ncbi:MAG: hypothetical protein JO307_21530 [Bryobacterales bacterium]|nr:hypothetical protein [Bryobacterales bacterium]MBV9397147.1 hypothetical protein [Bryobacterales bacterium]